VTTDPLDILLESLKFKSSIFARSARRSFSGVSSLRVIGPLSMCSLRGERLHGLPRTEALVMDRGAIARPLRLPADVLHARLPRR
jgi:hypothetical protein